MYTRDATLRTSLDDWICAWRKHSRRAKQTRNQQPSRRLAKTNTKQACQRPSLRQDHNRYFLTREINAICLTSLMVSSAYVTSLLLWHSLVWRVLERPDHCASTLVSADFKLTVFRLGACESLFETTCVGNAPLFEMPCVTVLHCVRARVDR